jgi:hypothetical protein
MRSALEETDERIEAFAEKCGYVAKNRYDYIRSRTESFAA